jgi:glycosyltransferase involved in cell wall biosynthesis
MASSIGIDCTNQRILLVTPQPYYEDRGTPIAIRQVLKALTELSYNVDVLAFPLGSSPESSGVRILRTANPLGIRRVPIGFSWRKVGLDLSLAAALHRRIIDPGYWCVHAVEEAAYIAAFLTRPGGPPLIYDMASILPEELSNHLLFRASGCAALMRPLERHVLNRVDHVVCSQGLGSYVQERCIGTPVTEWQFPGNSYPADAEARERIRAELGIGANAVACVYTGSFASYQGLNIVFEAIPDLRARAPNIVFVFVGAVPEDRRFIDRFKAPDYLGALRIVQRQPRERIADYLAAADVLLSPRANSRNTPLKIFDYLATGKPILASSGNAHRMVRHHRQVHYFTHTTEGFTSTILEVLAAKLPPLGISARGPAEDWENFRRQVGAIYGGVISAS